MRFFNQKDSLESSEAEVNKVSSGNAGFKGSVEHAGGDVRCDFFALWF